ncbi:TauD/TfdA family dioxygenase [Komagataeibacter sp. FNDCF1]|uniref:TauD/TfdA dioxygenase family protein n=1 Tax=Komagataeibacter sp. FNDCF1 TaxID=2878681 RepID=UPI001E313D7C|nr:TauD/TfdA family dioxygenase [Komagataeibacter sp. FNDCF1]MCE2563702.1 TauD/TfdA family dioxygenase [Komagataeibacter sp. FNDCF1]
MSSIPATHDLRVEKAGARLGAVIHGLDATQVIPPHKQAFLLDALVRHKVIFLRDQFLDDEQHERLSRVFGTPILHPTISAPPGTKYTFELRSRNGRSTDSWHTDVTFVPNYPKASILRAIEIPPYGGATLWANTATAYDDLPEALKRLADTAWGIHCNDYDTNYYKFDSRKEEIADFRAEFISRIYRTEHPVVRVHPESGERSLVLGHFITGLKGFPTREANRIVDILQDYITQIENTVSWNWKPGDVAIWDNRATQHYAPADFDSHPRELRRITVEGDVPVSVDGRRSRLVTDPDARDAS